MRVSHSRNPHALDVNFSHRNSKQNYTYGNSRGDAADFADEQDCINHDGHLFSNKGTATMRSVDCLFKVSGADQAMRRCTYYPASETWLPSTEV